jgi:hypothetical protein
MVIVGLVVAVVAIVLGASLSVCVAARTVGSPERLPVGSYCTTSDFRLICVLR